VYDCLVLPSLINYLTTPTECTVKQTETSKHKFRKTGSRRQASWRKATTTQAPSFTPVLRFRPFQEFKNQMPFLSGNLSVSQMNE